MSFFHDAFGSDDGDWLAVGGCLPCLRCGDLTEFECEPEVLADKRAPVCDACGGVDGVAGASASAASDQVERD